MKPSLTANQILEKIAAGAISSAEGFRLYRETREKSRSALSAPIAPPFPAPSEPGILYYQSVWEESTRSGQETRLNPDTPILLLTEQEALGKILIKQAPLMSLVKPGKKFKAREKGLFEINPQQPRDYQQLAASFKEMNRNPMVILHLWCFDLESARGEHVLDHQEKFLTRGLYSIYYLLNALAKQGMAMASLKRFIFAYQGGKTTFHPFWEAAAAYSRSLQHIYPDLLFSTLQAADKPGRDMELLADLLRQELQVTPGHFAREVLYEKETRWIKKVKPLEIPRSDISLLKKGGVYLITGGCGGLGLVFARYLAEKYQAALILTGRSPFDQTRRHALEEIKKLGSPVLYIQADAADMTTMLKVMERIKQEFGRLNGVIHSTAAAANEKLFIDKDFDQFKQTLEPKIQGTVVLDQVTKNEELDFFALFSSISSILGDFGQCDYAAASRFLDGYAGFREELRSKKQRWGKTIAINWPLWREGGKHISLEGEALYLQSTGMNYLETGTGLEAFETLLTAGNHQVMVLSGNKEHIHRSLEISIPGQPENKDVIPGQKTNPREKIVGTHSTQKAINQQIQEDIKKIVSDVIKIDPGRLELQENFGSYGFDSIGLKEFSIKLGKTYQVEISPTTFFHHSNIKDLSEYLLVEFGEEMRRYYSSAVSRLDPAGLESKIEKKSLARSLREEVHIVKNRAPAGENNEKKDIAIIGISGIFPGSPTLEELWDNLLTGKDLITEIPPDRWNWQDYYSESAAEDNKSISKWGGFIADVDKFDARFFNFSRREAELMDPQQRLLLEAGWKSFEDAGYSASDLSGRSVGVFIGAESGDYAQLLRERGIANPQMGIGNHHAVLSNRISFLLNLKGVSETINTGCSSSLVALNRAVRAIQAGECEMALVGGITLILSPTSMISASQIGLLSPDGRCKTFDKKANGYVRGEGLGIILLKPLGKASADHDHIYAVIKGTAVNHGGKANSFTAPNSHAQSELLVTAYKKAGIHPGTITYIEAHGTGTELGDPVEIDGLKQAFKKLTGKKENSSRSGHYCGLGTVKTNIGHLEPASGIAGVIKVILAIKYKTLPGNLHFREINPYIDLSDTPFYIVEKTKPWEPLLDCQGNPIPRRAGVSSFGFGGTNAHVVLEEYSTPAPRQNPQDQQVHLIVLSARNQDRLNVYAREILDFMQKKEPGQSLRDTEKSGHTDQVDEALHHQSLRDLLRKSAAHILNVQETEINIDEDLREYGFDAVHTAGLMKQVKEMVDHELPSVLFPAPVPLSIESLTRYLSSTLEGKTQQNSSPPGFCQGLPNIAYTLQVGRTAMEERMALIAASTKELQQKLTAYCKGETEIAGFYMGNIKTAGGFSPGLFAGSAGNEFIKNLVNQLDYNRLAQLWVSGVEIDWRLLYPGGLPRRISLPTYPFERERFWIPADHFSPTSLLKPGNPPLHPLIDGIDFQQSMNLANGLVFAKNLQKSDLLVRDHRVAGQSIFPGVGYLEMAHAAFSQINPNKNVTIRRVALLQPLLIQKESTAIRIVIQADRGKWQFRIQGCSETNQPPILYARGEFRVNDRPPGKKYQGLSIETIKSRCNRHINRKNLYETFKQKGITYGPYFQGVKQIVMNEEEALGYLQLPPGYEKELRYYTLHPGLVDSALQTTAGLAAGFAPHQDSQPMLPFWFEEIEILNPLKAQCIAYARRSDKNSFNVAVLDETGQVCIKFHHLAARQFKGEASTLSPLQARGENFLYKCKWVHYQQTENPREMNASNGTGKPPGTILVIAPPGIRGLEEALVQRHLHQNDRVIKIRLGSQTLQHSPGNWEIDTAALQAIDSFITQLEQVQRIYFLGGIAAGELKINNLDMEQLARTQDQGVISLFRLVKSLVRHGFSSKPLQISVITNNTRAVTGKEILNPYAASLHGFASSMAKEYTCWQVICQDINLEEIAPGASKEKRAATLDMICRTPPLPSGEIVAIREGKPYVQKIESLILPAAHRSPFRKQGVYLILGGAGGIGLELSRYLAETVQARLVLLGRSELNSRQKEKIAQIETLGAQVLYLQADAANPQSMKTAAAKAKSRFGSINGVVHSAIVLKDEPVESMTEENLRAVMAPKIQGSVVLYDVFKEEPLDFFLFFSSAQSLVCFAGQSNYAAASTFKDAFAHYLNQHTPYPIKIINWGYWGTVGIVASDEYNKRMAAQGIYSITPREGMDAIQRLLTHQVEQIIPYKVETRLLEEMEIHTGNRVMFYPERIPSLRQDLCQHLGAILAELEQPDIKENKETSTALDRYMHCLLLEAFREMGVFKTPGEQYEKEQLKQQLNIIPRYHRLYNALLQILAKAGFIEIKENHIRTLDKPEQQSQEETPGKPGDMKNHLKQEFPGIAAHVELAFVCISAYPRLLTGQENHMAVMFPGGAVTLVEPIYKGNQLKDFYNRVAARLIKTYIQLRQEKEPRAHIHILEAGAGTGGTSTFVLEAIKEYTGKIRYIYTDISGKFIQHGKKQFASIYPFMEFRVVDIEKPLDKQGIPGNSIDIVFATDVVHATKQVNHTLKQLKKVLKTNGLLILNEAVQNQDFGTLTFGLTDGWWLYEDEESRIPGSPLLTAAKWKQIMEKNGFKPIEIPVFSKETVEAGEEPFQNVIIGESNGEVAVEPYESINGKSEIKLYPIDLFNETLIEHLNTHRPKHPSNPQENIAGKDSPAIGIEGKPGEKNQFPPRKPLPGTAALNDGKDSKGVQEMITEILAQVLKFDKSEFAPDISFQDYGVDSLLAVEIIERINERLGTSLRATDLFNYSTIKELCTYISGDPGKSVVQPGPGYVNLPKGQEVSDGQPSRVGEVVGGEELFYHGENQLPGTRDQSQDIAVIGMSCLFPDARDANEFWNNLVTGKNSVREIPGNRWQVNTVDNRDEQVDTRWGAFLSGIDRFDAQFFHMSPAQAEVTDPQQRLFLQEAWRALEDAGYPDRDLRGLKCGVFVGCGGGDYGIKLKESMSRPSVESFTGNVASILPARVSYHLNLKGPAVAVDTACSSSLVAIHLACESLRSGECSLALAGGVMISTTSSFHTLAGASGMLSPGGQCRTFDDTADGFVPGEGVGVVVLKPLFEAQQERNNIYGIIKGSGMNHNGKTIGITAPSAASQTALERQVYDRFDINPETISYIEAHGTGTRLGDSIEIDALTDTFRKYTQKKQFCALGSVKTNIGHTLSAAGVAGVIKVLLAFKHKRLPPSLHFKIPNRYINFKETPFYVNSSLADWQDTGHPRRAAVSAFGFSGTNAHIVLETPSPDTGETGGHAPMTAEQPVKIRPYYFIPISAKTKSALEQKYKDLLNWLEYSANESIGNIAYTLHMGRSHFSLRTALLAEDLGDLKQKLKDLCETGNTMDCFFYCLNLAKGNPDPDLTREGSRLIKEIEQNTLSESEYKKKLIALAELYIKGYDLDCTGIYQKEDKRRISVPTYPFRGESYWLHPAPPGENSMKDEEIKELLYKLESGEITVSEAEYLTEGKL